MDIGKIIEIFNRDITHIHNIQHLELRKKIILDAISFYTAERRLEDGHQSKIYTNREYELLIELYANELRYI